MTLRVNEIFYSIQGESTYTGLPCVFVRLTGCNLRCSYCDTKYAYSEGQETRISEIIEQVSAFECKLVEITGGEPLLQAKTPHLIRELLENGNSVLLETNGTQDISLVDERCIRIVDMKCPSSGESEKNNLDNLSRLSTNDELKFVIGDRKDFEYAKSLLNMISPILLDSGRVLLSVIFGKLEPKMLAAWILEDRLKVRFQLQQHKYIWDPDLRGV